MNELDWASKAYQESCESGDDWAKKKSDFNNLDRLRHTVLAKIKLGFTDIKSDAGKETAARASQDYQDFLEELRQAESDYLHADVKYNGIKSLGSFRQTQESLKKAEITAQNQMT